MANKNKVIVRLSTEMKYPTTVSIVPPKPITDRIIEKEKTIEKNKDDDKSKK